MSNIQLDYSDIMDIFKEKLKIDNIVKKVSSIFLNQRYAGKINYKPYFQRNYVWDEEKATYFIESILLGTEIPPLVLFQTKDKNEVIDGRQRYETIKRFLEDKLVLKDKGLHNLKALAGKRYSQLDSDTRELFEDTRIRILQFSVVDEPKLDEEKEEKIKKEIFRRYNSGITPLQKYDIDRAAYINDKLSNLLYDKIYNNTGLYNFLCEIILPKSKKKASKRDKVNIIVSLVRNLITLPFVPIFSYSKGSSKADIIGKYYYSILESKSADEILVEFDNVISYLSKFNIVCKERNNYLCDNKLFYEVLYWAIDIVLQNGGQIEDIKIEQVFDYISGASENLKLWDNIINNPQRSVELIFESTGSHYYSATNNRYKFIANIFQDIFKIDYQKYMKNPEAFFEMMECTSEKDQISHYKINKPLPETLTIEDIISDMNLCYSEHARRYLNASGVAKERTYVTGSPMAEVLSENLSAIESSDIHARLGLRKRQYILLSAHREENIDTDKNFASLFEGINAMAEKYDMPVLYSCHPRSRNRLESSGFELDSRVIRHAPLGFHDYNCLQMHAYAVVSDSGTLPEESSFFTSVGHSFPAVCIRTSTERPAALDKGCFILAGIDKASLLQAVDTAVEMNRNGDNGVPVPDYMDRNVSTKVVKLIQSYTGIVNKIVWRKS